MTNVVIYEDNIRLQQSLELLLSGSTELRVTGTFANCDNVIVNMETCDAHLVVMDIDMPGVNGIDGVKKIKSSYPEIKVIMHTVFDDDNRIFECLCAGADGYLLKNTSPIKFIEALDDLIHGGAPMSPFVAQKVFQFFRQKQMPDNDFNLTVREKAVLELLVKGNSYKMIASVCTISIDTVKRHLQNIYHKLHVSCGTEAVAKALRHKIIRFED
ncbi:MAG: response regulator transcription factor [Chitinophagaceae bacterium]|nr:response regulator transcription factor [Chitinophagaceae bacterium]